jgi:hypothetical protein
MPATLPEEGRVLAGQFLSFDKVVGWGHVAGLDGHLYLVRITGFVAGLPPVGAAVEFHAVEGVHAREARRVRRVKGG